MTLDPAIRQAIAARAAHTCELCSANDDLEAHAVPLNPAAPVAPADSALLACGACRTQLADGAMLESTHWFCLQESIWSEVPVVQVVSWRMLQRLSGETWAADVLEQAYLDDAVMAWATLVSVADDGDADVDAPTLDSNGTVLLDGDSVTVIKDLDVKGTSFVAKRGTVVRGIRLTGDPENIEGRVNKVHLVLKTCFLKKVN
ncbi:MAG: protein PhnA [Myxococcota bacterium]